VKALKKKQQERQKVLKKREQNNQTVKANLLAHGRSDGKGSMQSTEKLNQEFNCAKQEIEKKELAIENSKHKVKQIQQELKALQVEYKKLLQEEPKLKEKKTKVDKATAKISKIEKDIQTANKAVRSWPDRFSDSTWSGWDADGLCKMQVLMRKRVVPNGMKLVCNKRNMRYKPDEDSVAVITLPTTRPLIHPRTRPLPHPLSHPLLPHSFIALRFGGCLHNGYEMSRIEDFKKEENNPPQQSTGLCCTTDAVYTM